MEGAAHHLDLRAANSADPDSVVAARNYYRQVMKEWIKNYWFCYNNSYNFKTCKSAALKQSLKQATSYWQVRFNYLIPLKDFHKQIYSLINYKMEWMKLPTLAAMLYPLLLVYFLNSLHIVQLHKTLNLMLFQNSCWIL